MSVRFDASGDSLSRTTGLPPIASFTIMGWYSWVVDSNTFATCHSYGNTAASGYHQTGLDLTTTNSNLFHWNSATTGTGSTLALNTWYHVATVVSGTGAGGVTVYLNGKADISMSGSTNPTQTKMFVGNDVDLDWMNARAAFVKVFDRALSQAEVWREMLSRAPVSRLGLNAYYPLAGAGDYFDRGPYQRHWTVGGTLASEGDPTGVKRPRRRRAVGRRAVASFTPNEPSIAPCPPVYFLPPVRLPL